MPQFIVHELIPAPAVTTFSFLAQTPAPAPAGASPDAGSSTIQFLIPILIVAGVYYIIFAPHMKRQKEHKALVAALKTGDEVVTSGGIFGVITQVKGDRLVVEIAKNTRVELEKTAVTAVVAAEKEEQPSPPAGKGVQA